MSRHAAAFFLVALLAACEKSPPPRRVLGGIDGDAYCKGKGGTRVYWKQTPGVFDGKKTWGCEQPNGTWEPFSVGVVCTAQYKTTAHGEQERDDDPISWVCVEGPGPAQPPATWNRANL